MLAKARCDAEVRVIMEDVAQALGVGCTYCHQAGDYAAMTHNKLIANWMARDLATSLRKKSDGAEPWCSDCHHASTKGTAKILGEPRDLSLAVEWMTAHLTATLERSNGQPLYCATCHEQTWGSPGFVGRVIPFERRGNGVAEAVAPRDDDAPHAVDEEAADAASTADDPN